MTTRDTIEEEIQQLESIRRLAETYESVAALYVRRTKQSVLTSRLFHDGIQNIYNEVVTAHHKELQKAFQRESLIKKLRGAVRATKRQSQTVAVLLSTNTGLYGSVIQKTVASFVEHVATQSGDLIVAGARGKYLIEEQLPSTSFTYWELSDHTLTPHILATLAQHLAKYTEIHIFYSKFESFTSQIPVETRLQGSHKLSQPEKGELSTRRSAVAYLFEPSLEDVAHFFETEIFASLIEQVLHESRLAKLASRIHLLDSATVRMGHALDTARFRQQKINHDRINKKQLETVTARIALHT